MRSEKYVPNDQVMLEFEWEKKKKSALNTAAYLSRRIIGRISTMVEPALARAESLFHPTTTSLIAEFTEKHDLPKVLS